MKYTLRMYFRLYAKFWCKRFSGWSMDLLIGIKFNKLEKLGTIVGSRWYDFLEISVQSCLFNIHWVRVVFIRNNSKMLSSTRNWPFQDLFQRCVKFRYLIESFLQSSDKRIFRPLVFNDENKLLYTTINRFVVIFAADFEVH